MQQEETIKHCIGETMSFRCDENFTGTTFGYPEIGYLGRKNRRQYNLILLKQRKPERPRRKRRLKEEKKVRANVFREFIVISYVTRTLREPQKRDHQLTNSYESLNEPMPSTS